MSLMNRDETVTCRFFIPFQEMVSFWSVALKHSLTAFLPLMRYSADNIFTPLWRYYMGVFNRIKVKSMSYCTGTLNVAKIFLRLENNICTL